MNEAEEIIKQDVIDAQKRATAHRRAAVHNQLTSVATSAAADRAEAQAKLDRFPPSPRENEIVAELAEISDLDPETIAIRRMHAGEQVSRKELEKQFDPIMQQRRGTLEAELRELRHQRMLRREAIEKQEARDRSPILHTQRRQFQDLDDVMIVPTVSEWYEARVFLDRFEFHFSGVSFASAGDPVLEAIDKTREMFVARGAPHHLRVVTLTGDDRWDLRKVLAAIGMVTFDSSGKLACARWLEGVHDTRVLVRWAAFAETNELTGRASFLSRKDRPIGSAPLAEACWTAAKWIADTVPDAGTVESAVSFWQAKWDAQMREHPELLAPAAIAPQPVTRRRLSKGQSHELRQLTRSDPEERAADDADAIEVPAETSEEAQVTP